MIIIVILNQHIHVHVYGLQCLVVLNKKLFVNILTCMCFFQVLQFETHSSFDLPLLSLTQSFSLLEQLDSTQTELAIMLTSRYIHPLKNECAQWAGKLASIAEILHVWLSVQELWLSLQPVFSNTQAAQVINSISTCIECTYMYIYSTCICQ